MSNVVVVVDPDGQSARTIDRAAGDAFDVIACSTARAGLNACCALEPSCLVTLQRLPDHDGLWLAEAVRAQPSPISMVPIVMVGDDEEPLRVRALQGGVDVFVKSRAATVELVAQVRALMAMAERVRERRSVMPSSIPDTAALRGDLDRMPIATVLGALELDKRSGEIWIRGARGSSVQRKLVLVIASGVVVSGQVDGEHLAPIDALRAALDWEGRRFEFLPGPSRTPPPSCSSLGKLMLQAMRFIDESPRVPQRSGTRVSAQEVARRASLADNAPGLELVEEVVKTNDPRRENDSDRPTIPFLAGGRR